MLSTFHGAVERIGACHGAEEFPHDFPLTVLLSANTWISL